MSEKEITFLDTKVQKGVRFNKESILDVQTHYQLTETFQYKNSSTRVTYQAWRKASLKEKR